LRPFLFPNFVAVSTPLVHYRSYGNPDNPTLFILHGIFGMLDNWHYAAGILSEQYHVVSFDARNHGKSFHDPAMSFESMSADLYRLMAHLELEKADIMGHSMGGKTVMHFAMQHPDRIRKLLVVDIAPKAYRPGHIPYFDAFEQIPFDRIETRKEADEAFRHYAPDPAVRQFLLKNLEPLAAGGYKTKFNLAALKKSYPQIIGALQLDNVFSGPAMFIYGKRSGYVRAEDQIEILQHFPAATFKGIPDAGHWVHADQPALFLEAVQAFLRD
jgi:esterase